MIRSVRLSARRRAARRADAVQAAETKAAMDRLILRDLLAIERTRLANERTILAYARTGFACLAGALTLVQLFETSGARASAAALAVAGVALFALGVRRYRIVGQLVRGYALRGDPPEQPAPSGTAAPRGTAAPAVA